MSSDMKRVLFVCVHNSGRSQMAEAFFNHLAQGRATAVSAGTQPEGQVNPTVVQAMAELGIDLSRQRPQVLTQAMLDEAERAITMGCNVEEACPANLVPTEDWALEDPKGKPLEGMREIRNQVQRRVEALIDELGLVSEAL